MRFNWHELNGYAGIFNGMGIKSIKVVFPKTKNKIVLLKGDNGKGKSTFWRSLSPLPDDNNNFIPGCPASKKGQIEHNGSLYEYQLIHNVKANGDRETSKGYIRLNGVELNPNGNISSYKDIIFNELNLDDNFEALSALSNYNRGLGVKKPTERKNIVNGIITELVDYNNINKKITKKASSYKALMQNIVAKLGTIGNEEKLESLLVSLTNRIEILEKEKENILKDTAVRESGICTKDPTGKIQETYNEVASNINRLKHEADNIIKDIEKLQKALNVDDLSKVKDKFDSITKEIESIFKTSIKLEGDKTVYTNLIESQAEVMNNLNIEFMNLDYDDFYYKENLSLKNQLEEQLKMFKANDTTFVLKSEIYIDALDTLKNIDEFIDSIRNEYSVDIIKEGIISTNIDILKMYDDAQNLNTNISQKTELLNQTYGKLETLKDLEKRPSDCHNDLCPFIAKAIDIKRQEPQRMIDSLESDLLIMRQEQSEMSKNITKAESIIRFQKSFKELQRFVNSNIEKLNKADIGKEVIESLKNIIHSYKSMYQVYGSNLENHLRLSEEKKMYYETKEQLDKIKLELQSTESRFKEVEKIKQNLDKAKLTIESYYDKLSHINSELQKVNSLTNDLELVKLSLSNLIELINKKNIIDTEYAGYKSTLTSIYNSMIDINSYKKEIIELNNRLDDINKTLKPLRDEKESVTYGIKMAREYKEELEIYKTKFDKMEVIKYHSSSRTGIQIIFMELYMHNIIDIANQLLGMMFNGEYVLQKFILDEKEFKIPCLGSGIINDDISSMSDSQISMISMIISFAILNQSSSIYNILKLDEIDAALDTNNRLTFIKLLEAIIQILNVEQCFLISHNNETDLSKVDTVIFLTQNDTSDLYQYSNVIYDYNR